MRPTRCSCLGGVFVCADRGRQCRRPAVSLLCAAPWRNRTSINRLKAGCSAVELKGLGGIVGGAPGVISGTIVQ